MSSLSTKEIPEEHGKAILTEMLKRVGENYDTFDFTQPQWYWKHEWTQEEQDDFVAWVANYFVDNKVFTMRKYRDRPEAIHRAEQIVASYGWKVKE